jgi:hypothetical protein
MSDRIESAGVSCVGGELGVPMASTFPADAVAVIYRPTRSAEDDHARANVTSRYDRPSEVARDPKLSVERKRNLLRQWALDAYRTEVATMDGMPPSASQLDEAIDALIDLDGGTASMSKRSTIRSATAGDRAQAA